MKVSFNKQAYCDLMRRTRLIRILLLIAIPLLELLQYKECSLRPAEMIPDFIIGALMLALLFQDLSISRLYRKRKCEVFYALPVRKKDWYGTMFASELSTVLFGLVVLEGTDFVLGQIYGSLKEGNRKAFLYGWFSGHLYRLLYIFAATMLFMAILNVIRELTHSLLTYLILLAWVEVNLYFLQNVLEFFCHTIGKGFVEYDDWLIYRCMKVTFLRGRGEFVEEDYRCGAAILICLLLAVVLLAVGAFLSGRSKAEYVEAEYRNKLLFRILLVCTTMTMVFFAFLNIQDIYEGETSGSLLLLLPVLLILVDYLLCRLFHEKLRIGIIGYILTGAALSGAVFLTFYGALSIRMNLPKMNRVTAVQWEYSGYSGFSADRDDIEYLHGMIVAEKERLDNPETESQRPLEMVRVSFYTKNRNYTYDVYVDREWLWVTDEPTPLVSLGRKPVPDIEGFSSKEKYDAFMAAVPKENAKEVHWYYYDWLGRLRESKDTAIIGSGEAVGKNEITVPLSFYNLNWSGAINVPADSKASEIVQKELKITQKERYLKCRKQFKESYSDFSFQRVVFLTHSEEKYLTDITCMPYGRNMGWWSYREPNLPQSFGLSDETVAILEKILDDIYEKPEYTGQDSVSLYVEISLLDQDGFIDEDGFLFYISQEQMAELGNAAGKDWEDYRLRRPELFRDPEQEQ